MFPSQSKACRQALDVVRVPRARRLRPLDGWIDEPDAGHRRLAEIGRHRFEDRALDMAVGVEEGDDAIFGFENAALRIDEVAQCLGAATPDGSAADLLVFLRPLASRCFCFSALMRRSSSPAAFASAPSSALATAILTSRFCLSATQSSSL
jgi:hypothetical protein